MTQISDLRFLKSPYDFQTRVHFINFGTSHTIVLMFSIRAMKKNRSGYLQVGIQKHMITPLVLVITVGSISFTIISYPDMLPDELQRREWDDLKKLPLYDTAVFI